MLRGEVTTSLIRECEQESDAARLIKLMGRLPGEMWHSRESTYLHAELRILALARRRLQHSVAPCSDLALLSMLQHHGLPTRLLDVSTDPYTALWFACAAQPCEAGALFAFNVEKCEKIRTDDMSKKSGLKAAVDGTQKTRRPFLLIPSKPNARMRAQGGMFLAGHHTYDRIPIRAFPLPDLSPLRHEDVKDIMAGHLTSIPFFFVLVIPPEFKSLLLTWLSRLEGKHAKTRERLFPDLPALRDDYYGGELDVPLLRWGDAARPDVEHPPG